MRQREPNSASLSRASSTGLNLLTKPRRSSFNDKERAEVSQASIETVSKAGPGETQSERRSGESMVFPERLDTVLS